MLNKVLGGFEVKGNIMPVLDVAVIGGGPGGYAAAIRAAQLGMKTGLIESTKLGGLCLNWGCVPSKALLRNAQVVSMIGKSKEFGINVNGVSVDLGAGVQRSRRVVSRLVKGVEFLMEKNGIEVFHGMARLVKKDEISVDSLTENIKANAIILATGAKNLLLNDFPMDHDAIISSREALELKELPQKIMIIGGGPIGVEFATYFSSYGSEVTIVEMLEQLLPNEDGEIASALRRSFEKDGINVMTDAQVHGFEQGDNGAVSVEVITGSSSRVIEADKILVAVGFAGQTDSLGLDDVGVDVQDRWIKVNGNMQTTGSGVYAVGDVTGPPLLAHVAEAQGILAAEHIAGMDPTQLEYENIPRAVYSRPQIASIGVTESEAKNRGIDVNVGQFPYRASGKAIAMAEYDGFIKILSDAENEKILGAHMIGPDCSELIGEISLAIKLGATALDLGSSIHPHPTLSEGLMDAALGTYGNAVHV